MPFPLRKAPVGTEKKKEKERKKKRSGGGEGKEKVEGAVRLERRGL